MRAKRVRVLRAMYKEAKFDSLKFSFKAFKRAFHWDLQKSTRAELKYKKEPKTYWNYKSNRALRRKDPTITKIVEGRAVKHEVATV